VLVALIHGIGGRAASAVSVSVFHHDSTFYPPLGFDHEVIVWLRRIATQASSGVLDMIGIAHAVAGNVIETEKERLMVEDACSGINSLLSVCSCVLFYLFSFNAVGFTLDCFLAFRLIGFFWRMPRVLSS
jgi:hypothetical protein